MDQITISRQKMSEALAMLCKATPARTVPLLQHVILTADSENLVMRTTNLELTLIRTVKLSGMVELAGENWPNGKLLPGPFVSNLLSKCKEETVTFSWEQSESMDTMVLQVGRLRSQVNNIPTASEFPFPPDVATGGMAFNGMDLERLLDLALPFTARELPPQAFNSLFLSVEAGQITAIGSDRHRMARIRLSGAPCAPGTTFSCLLPWSQLKTVLPFIGNDHVVLSVNGKFACFTGSGWQAIITLSEDQYPDVSQIMPVDHQLRIECEKDSLLLALRLCSEVSGWDPAVEMHLDEQLSIQNRGTYGEALQPFEGSIIKGTDLLGKQLDVIRLNWRFLHDIVKQIPSRYIILETNGYCRSVIVYGKTQPANWDETYLLMPMRREEIESRESGESGDGHEQENGETGQSQEQEASAAEIQEMEYVCGNCDFYDSDMCLGNSPQPDEPCCDKFRPKATLAETVPQEVHGQDGSGSVVPSAGEEEHCCGECASFATATCPHGSESEEAAACEIFSLNQELVGAQT